MRQNPYEKLKKIIAGLGFAIVAVLIVLLVIWAGSRASDGTKKKSVADKNSENTEKEASEIIIETETYYDDEIDSKLKELEELFKQQESEEMDAPQGRDVAPEADPNYDATVAVPEAVPDENAQPDVTQQ